MNLNFLRQRNRFQQDPVPGFDIPSEDEQNFDDIYGEAENDEQPPLVDEGLPEQFSRLFQAARDVPPGQAEERYTKFQNEPQPTFKPTKLNRLAAILGGASEGGLRGAGAGVRTAHDILEAPYNRAIQAHKLRGSQLKEGAEIESRNLGRAASIARQATTAANAQATLKQRQDYHNRLFAKWDSDDKARASRAPGVHWEVSKESGNIMGFKLGADGKMEVFSGPKVGQNLTEAQQAKLEDFISQEEVRQPNRLAVVAAQGEEQRKNETKRQEGRMAIRKFMQDNKDFQFKEVAGGNYMAFDPTDPSNVIDTGIKSGTLTDADKIELGIQGRIKTQENQAGIDQTAANKKAAAEQELIKNRGTEQRRTQAANPQFQNREAQLKMKKALIKNPNMKDYFEYDPNSNESIPIAIKAGAPDDELYQQLYEYVYGKRKKK